jgi:hypothetical protein
MRIIITTIVLALTSSAAAAQRPPQVPVMITSDPAYTQPCSIGVVVGLDPRGDRFLAVKSAPDLQSARIDRLYNGN